MSPVALVDQSPAQRHRLIAGAFADRVRGTSDWDAPTPVAEWTTRDVVMHLVEWLPALLADGGVPFDLARSADPVTAWEDHAARVQALLEEPDASRSFTHRHLGALPLDQAIDRFYTADVFQHTWDLARATGQDDRLDDALCAELLEGLGPIEGIMRSSGQFGPAVAVPADAPVQDRLIGFIGRDPAWRPR